jgi:predicted O-methyltransferase YrrM
VPRLQARRVVEFGTSYGVSTLYLAAAKRDQGSGLVIGTKLKPKRRAMRATISRKPELPI